MTKFRLNAGRPAACHGGGSPARKEAVEVKPRRIRQNNELPDVPLTCGCTIPWPIITLLGSRPKKVHCDQHGYQTIRKEKKKKCPAPPNPNQPSILDIPPF